jgi:short-subunit dehydrogenase
VVRDLRNKRILVTGASGGIGRCIAEQAAAAGARLVITGRSTERLEAVVQEIQVHGGDVRALPADLAVDAERKRLMEYVSEQLGGLDVLINNAGVGSFGHFSSSTEAVLRQVMEINFFAPAELIRLAIPALTHGVQPAVLNLASMCGRRGMPAWTEYSASKFALVGLTEALRAELARFDIDVLLVLPGLTASNLPSGFLRNEGRYPIDFAGGMPPATVAAGVLNALRHNKTETVLGRDARWILLVNKFMPRLVNYLLARKVKKLYAEAK